MRVLEIAAEIKSKHNMPIAIMTYYNPVFHLGLDKFLESAKEHGVDGFIVPDLPVEEAGDYRKAAKSHNLETIFFASPATSKERLSKIVEASSGFLYLVSCFGVTGAQSDVANSTLQLIKRVGQDTAGKIPLAVGFGISKPEHVKRVIGAGADAAIVGSAFINIIEKNQKGMLKELQETAQALKAATKNKTA
jgi:tryptophan synthase alpha chain